MATLFCRICGYEHPEPPWGADGQCPTYAFCDCCGVEAGYEDCTYASTSSFRQAWLADGAAWLFPKCKPAHWDLQRQLKNIPPAFR
jgi:hypothetical protein